MTPTVIAMPMTNMRRWTGAGAWQPIGGFVGMFKGNNKTIANLRVEARVWSGGLFASIGSNERVAHIDGIGLSGVDIKSLGSCRDRLIVSAMHDKQ